MAKTILDALKGGAINLFRLEGEPDQCVFALVRKADDKETVTYIVPCIKNAAGAVAYVDPTLSTQEILWVSDVINLINESKVFKGIYAYKPIGASAPTHSMELGDFVRVGENVMAKEAVAALKAAGYKTKESTSIGYSFARRDYSSLIASSKEAADRVADNHEELEMMGITFDSLSGEVKSAYDSVKSGRSIGIIFEGPTGTGKSFAARILADHDGAPLLNLQIDAGTTTDNLLGMFVPSTSGTGAKYEWVDGPLLKAYKEGWQLVIEEVNYGQPAVLSTLNQFTDATQRITVNGESYKRHPNFVVYMTMNPGYTETNVLNVALKNRFAKVNVPALTPNEFAERMVAYSKMLGHALPKTFFTKLHAFAALVEDEARGSQWHEDVRFSVRNAQRLLDVILMKGVKYSEFADALAVQYLNDLSTDNDNSDALEKYKSDPTIVAAMKDMFDDYDLREVKTSSASFGLDDLFADAPSEEHEAKKRSAASKAFEQFGR